MSGRKLSISFLVFWILIDSCHCASNTIRVLEKPNIRPLYLNASVSKEENRVTVHGRFQCPKDTKVSFFEYYDGRLVKFDKVLNSKENTTDCELVLYYDKDRYKPSFWLRSKTASEVLVTYVSMMVKNSVQSEFSGTDCFVGLNRSYQNQTTTYTSVIQNCDQSPRILENFSIWLNKSGKIISLTSDIYCSDSKSKYMKYFKSRCSSYVSDDPFFIDIYEDKMADDNVKIIDLRYKFEPVEPVRHCPKACVTDTKRWRFTII